MQKRGTKAISPLIATVLIIGFTIILAAAIFTWGSNLTKLQIKQTSEEAEANIKCIGVSMNIKTACILGGTAQVYFENTGREDISSFKYRIIGETMSVSQLKISLPVYAASTVPFSLNETIVGTKELEIYPQVTVKDKEFTCKQPTKKELVSCFDLLKLKTAADFDNHTYSSVYITSEKEVNALKSELIARGGIFADLAETINIGEAENGLPLPEKILVAIFTGGQDENGNEITSGSVESPHFTIPNNPSITRIGLYAKASIPTDYTLVIPGRGYTKEIQSLDSTSGTVKQIVEFQAKDYAGEDAYLRLDLAGIGYATVFRFCWTNDQTPFCVA